MLLNAETTVPADDGVVAAGKVVTYKFEGDKDDEAETFLLGARENEEYVDGLTVFSPQAPLGAALLGAETGGGRRVHRPQRPHQQGRGRLGRALPADSPRGAHSMTR